MKVCDFIKTNKFNYSPKDKWEYIYYLDTGNITENHIEKIVKLDPLVDKIPSRAKRKVKKGNIIYSTVRPNQKHYGYIDKEYDNLLVSTGFIVIDIDENIADSKYFYYWLTQEKNTNYLQAIAENTVATYPSIAPKDIENMLIELPLFAVQQKIAKILSNYDDLIENNNKRIKILEEMAQKIYKEWFVDFKYPGHETATFKDTELGKIPSDWKIQPLHKILLHQIGGGWGQDTKDEVYSEKAFVIRGTDIPGCKKGNVSNCPLRYHTLSNIKSRRLEVNDIVFEVSGGSKGQPVGRALLLNKNLFNQFTGNVICASFCRLLRIDKEIIIPEYIYMHFLNIYMNREIEKYQTQSTGIINFKFNDFLENEKIIIPSNNIICIFKKTIVPIFDKIFLLGSINNLLKTTRDMLLPRLISGEIDVEHMEIQ